MLRNFLIFTVFLIALNASTMFLFPNVFEQTNEQIITKLNSDLTVKNMQDDKTEFTSADIQTFSTTETDETIAKSSADTDDTTSTRGSENFDDNQQNLLSFLNLAAGYINLMVYFKVATPWIYTVTAILGFFQLIGAFFFFQVILSSFAGIIRGVI